MKIAPEVCGYAKEKGVERKKAPAVGTAEKSKEFSASGAEIHHGDLSEGAPEPH